MTAQTVLSAWDHFVDTTNIKRPETQLEYQRLLEIMDDLSERSSFDAPHVSGLADLLTSYIGDWERQHEPDITASPAEVLEELMLERELTQTALARDLQVSQGIISRVLSEERAVSKALAKKLAAYFGVRLDLFL